MTITGCKARYILADYLQSLGYYARQAAGQEACGTNHRSREETDASFKVNTELEPMVRLRHQARAATSSLWQQELYGSDDVAYLLEHA